VRRIADRYQRTLARPTDVPGVGFVTGARVRLRFRPAPAHTGVLFVRTDLPGPPAAVPARAAAVTDTRRRTTLGPAAAGVTLVEHVLAALAGLRVDNCVVELDGPEPPGLDGSAWGYVEAIHAAGIVAQNTPRPVLGVDEPVVVAGNGATIALHPADGPGLRVSYVLDYGPVGPIPRQAFTLDVTPEGFLNEVAGSRTFLLEAEAAALRAQGVGRHLTPRDLLVFGPRGPIDNTLRYADEPARHKVLDILGDLALCGFDLAGHVVAYRSGHALTVELAKVLARQAAGADTDVRPRVSRRAA
jgi:UDP-3-O-acyl N-acetylglucosamine deacetylase